MTNRFYPIPGSSSSKREHFHVLHQEFLPIPDTSLTAHLQNLPKKALSSSSTSAIQRPYTDLSASGKFNSTPVTASFLWVQSISGKFQTIFCMDLERLLKQARKHVQTFSTLVHVNRLLHTISVANLRVITADKPIVLITQNKAKSDKRHLDQRKCFASTQRNLVFSTHSLKEATERLSTEPNDNIAARCGSCRKEHDGTRRKAAIIGQCKQRRQSNCSHLNAGKRAKH